MKVVAINGSARKDGNTAILVKKVFGELEKTQPGARGEVKTQTELARLAGVSCARITQIMKLLIHVVARAL